MLLYLDGSRGRVSLRVELADTPDAKTKGLRGRTFIAPNTGMLFVWDAPQPITMTMRDTGISLDIAFVSDGRITSIARAIPARTQSLIAGWGQYVIEAPPGYFARNYIALGSLVTVANLPPVNLLTSHYTDKHPARQGEILTTLEQNIANSRIARIHLFDETSSIRCGSRIQRVGPRIGVPRVTYRDFFDYANTYLPGQIAIIANADIFFDDSLAALVEHGLNGTLMCLSRWDEQPGRAPVHFLNPESHDAWVFQAPIRPFSCDWPLGVPGCDSRLAAEAKRAGLRLINPSRSIRARHLHTSNLRNYTPEQRINGEYLGVPIDGAGTEERTPVVVAAGAITWAPVGFLYKK